MSLQRFSLLLAALLLAIPIFGQATLNADLPKMSNLAFGWVAMSGVDPSLDALASFAPTMLGLRDAGYGIGSEVATGTFSFGDFDVDSGWESGLINLGPGVFRVAHYDFRSNTAQVAGIALPPGMPPGTPPLLAQTDGESLELSYAQRIGKTSYGISVIPADSTGITILQGGFPVATGKSKADYGYRLGFVTPVERRHDIRLGVNYSYQKDQATLTPNPLHPLVIATGAVPTADTYRTQCYTVGASGKLTARTQLYGAYQKIVGKGSAMGFDRDSEQIWFGVNQSLTSILNLRVNYLQKGINVGLTCRTPVGLLIAAYTNKALVNANDVLGKGDALFVGIDIAK